MDVNKMELKDYCCLNRPRFRVEPESDSEWYFGNQQVNDELLVRIRDDFDIRGVPKCGLIGRFGDGKTHTLHHIKYLFGKDPISYPSICFFLRLAPYDERIPDLSGWKYIHGKMLDAMGEDFLRQVVRDFDNLPESRTAEISGEMRKIFSFGDENLNRSLANIFSGYFLRETKSTVQAWQWLKGYKIDKGSAQDLGTTKTLETAGDMLSVILNIGNLVRKTTGKGILFLMDEAQSLNEVDKRQIEIHDAFLQLSSDDNQDVGFVIAYFGTGQQAIPAVIAQPDDILSRLGVTRQNIEVAFIDLMRLINTKNDVKDFINNLLKNVKDTKKADELIKDENLSSKVTSESLPFTKDALDRICEILYQNEQTRNPRMIINEIARVAAKAYHESKQANKYILADRAVVDSVLR
ncbi:hypothetical protein ACFLT4_00905 [Chloroflexota bacterium]